MKNFMKAGEIKDFYISKISLYKAQKEKTIKKKKLFSYLRMVCFLGILVVLYYSSSLGSIPTVSILSILSAAFLFFVKKFNTIKIKIRKTSILIQINEDELNALNGDITQFHDGKEYIDYDHPYSYDTDIFGSGSLFCYLNRTVTVSGKNQLAKELSEIQSDKFLTEKKQEAVKEFANETDFRQDFCSTSILYDKQFKDSPHEKIDPVKAGLKEWSESTLSFINNKIWTALLIILPSVSFILLFSGITDMLPYAFMWLSVFINLSIIGMYLKKTNSEHQKLGKRTRSLLKIKELLNFIEFKEFKSDYLRSLNENLAQKGSSFGLIRKLYKTLNAFDMRLNMLTGILLNGFLLWDLQILKRLENQKRCIRENVDIIFDVIGKVDSLISLSNYHFNNPDFCFPEISEEEFVFEIKNGGHPLIDKNERVTNDFMIEGLQKIVIVTGANMAGKSTFLRTVGVNMILASCGAPVCATKMRFSPLPLYTSVRTNDSLQKNESYFFAELMRLKMITDMLKEGKKLFVIIDEMLKGTNSKDKHKGSYELIKQLIKLNTSGLAATHDIQLGKLAEEFPENVSNKRFEVEITNDELVFDYKLKDGISQNLNASFLMKKYGIIE